MEELSRFIAESIGYPDQQGLIYKILMTLLMLLLLWIVRRSVLLLVSKQTDDNKVRYNWRKGTAYGIYGLGILLISRVWFEGLASLTTYLGLLSAGLAVALKDPIANVAGWLFIIWRRPFEVGDRVQMGDYAGDVIDQRIFQFTILEIGNWVDADQSTGRIIHVPNGKVFTTDQANYSKAFSFIWDEVGVLITFESNWKKTKKILQDIAEQQDDLEEDARQKIREASSKYLIFYHKLTPRVYTSVRDSGVLLTIRYLCEPRQRRLRQETLWEEILDAFAAEPDIDLAYPTQRFYSLNEALPDAEETSKRKEDSAAESSSEKNNTGEQKRSGSEGF